MKHSETLDILRELKAAYPRQIVSRDTLAVYAANLEPFDPVDVRSAVRWHVRCSRFFPTIAELVGFVAERKLQLPSAPDAWGEVVSEMRRVGHVSRPTFSTDVVKGAVEQIGGWRRLCDSTNGVSDRARFLEAYGLLRRRCVEAVSQIGLKPGRQPLELGAS